MALFLSLSPVALTRSGMELTFFRVLRGAFDISLIASIASHLTYWGDEDVNHFMLSQMLSRKSRHRVRGVLKGGSAVDTPKS